MVFRINLMIKIPNRIIYAGGICLIAVISGFVLLYGNNTFSQNHYHATKTTYFNRPKFYAHEPLPWNLENIPKDLSPVYVDALFRHGTRYPSQQKVTKWKRTLMTLKNIKESSYTGFEDILQDWDKYFPAHLSYTLHEKGWIEMSYLAKHYFEMCKEAILKSFSKYLDKNRFFEVVTSNKLRVKTSARSFLGTISCLICNTIKDSKQAYDNICKEEYNETKILENDNKEVNGTLNYGGIKVLVNLEQMRPFDNCSRYFNFDQNRTEVEISFFMSPMFQSMVSNVSASLGVEQLGASDVYDLYQICTFMHALHDKTLVCDIFNKPQLEVLEYTTDLKHYYKTGYGHTINYLMLCPLMHNIVQRLDGVVAQFKQNKIISKSSMLRFGHAETLIPLLSLLGLFEDDIPLKHDNFDVHKHERKFRTGTFSPFAGNVGFVLYHNITSSRLNLLVVVNEYMVKFSNTDSYFIDYIQARSILLSHLNKVNCDSVCSM